MLCCSLLRLTTSIFMSLINLFNWSFMQNILVLPENREVSLRLSSISAAFYTDDDYLFHLNAAIIKFSLYYNTQIVTKRKNPTNYSLNSYYFRGGFFSPACWLRFRASTLQRTINHNHICTWNSNMTIDPL